MYTTGHFVEINATDSLWLFTSHTQNFNVNNFSNRCYDKDSYPTSTQDEFIVPVAFGGGLGSVPPLGLGSSLRPTTTTTLLGGERPLDIDDQVMEVVQMIVHEYNRREDDSEYYKLVKVHEASTQVRQLSMCVSLPLERLKLAIC